MRWLGAILTGGCVVLAFFGTSHLAAAQTPEGLVAIITSPLDGQQLFGMVTITGSAEHPSAFASYTLEYDSLNDPVEQWFLVQQPVTQQIRGGVLGAWNTNMVPDGDYQLRLRVSLNDGQIGEFVVTDLRVVNSQPTPVPTLAAGPTSAPPTPGPSLIEQPPSNNPSAGVVSGLGAASSAETPIELNRGTQPQARINMSRVRSAFCSGVYLAVGAFAAMLVYRIARARLRPYARRLVWQIQDDFNNDQQP